MDSSETTKVGLPRPEEPKVRSFATPVIDDSSVVRLPAIVMPWTGYVRSPFSRYSPVAPSENSPEIGSIV